jgi:hypothetical protein
MSRGASAAPSVPTVRQIARPPERHEAVRAKTALHSKGLVAVLEQVASRMLNSLPSGCACALGGSKRLFQGGCGLDPVVRSRS